MPDVGRNDPCPCGSRKKYKQCHLREQDAVSGLEAESLRIHERDRALALRMIAFTYARLGDDWPGFDDIDGDHLQFVIPLTLYHLPLDGGTIAKAFAESSKLSPDERRWLDAQLEAWYSVWEIIAIDPGRSLGIRDRLTGQIRTVIERAATATAKEHLHIFARVVDFEGKSYLCGIHPSSLTPLEADDVLEEIRHRLRVKRSVGPKRLQGFRVVEVLTDVWYEMLDARDAAARNRTLQNTDGDPFVLVTDRFAYSGANEKAIRAALLGIDGAEAAEDEIVVVRDDTLILAITISAGRLACATNSLRRADSARPMIESACGDKVRFVSRDLTDPLSAAHRDRTRPSAPPPDAEMRDLAREYKRQHYVRWLDESIPALNGMTPRDAVKTPRGRERLDALLNDIEYREGSLRAEERMDLSWLRRELGLAAPEE